MNPPAAPLDARKRAAVTRPRIACDDVACFEAALTLGESTAVMLVRRGHGVREALVGLPVQPNLVEELTPALIQQSGIDLVVARPETGAVDRYRRQGLSVLAWNAPRWTQDYDVLAFVEAHKRNMRVLAQALGPEAQQCETDWEQYVDTKVAFVWSRTRYRPRDMHPRAAYLDDALGGPDGGVTAYVYAYGRLGGANMARHGPSKTWPACSLSKEELLAWNPEQIYVGRSALRADLLSDPTLRGVHAVSHRAVYALPATAFAWDDGPESVLLMLWIANLAQPALFSELDIENEVRAYYDRFYSVSLSAADLARMFAPGL